MENNHSTATATAATIDKQFDALKSDLKKMIDKFEPPSTGLFKSLTKSIKTHPLAAAALAFGIGYAVIAIARRRS